MMAFGWTVGPLANQPMAAKRWRQQSCNWGHGNPEEANRLEVVLETIAGCNHCMAGCRGEMNY
jgi:hypothetical protein